MLALFVSVLGVAGVPALAQADEYTIGTHEGVGAIFRSGELYAFPLAAPVDLVVLDDGTIILLDSLIGVVGVGGRMGDDPGQPGLAARVELVPLTDGHSISLTGDGDLVFVVAGPDNALAIVDPFSQQVEVLGDGLEDPRGVAEDTSGRSHVCEYGSGTIVVLDDDGNFVPIAEVPWPTEIVAVASPDDPADAPGGTMLIVSDPDESVEGDEQTWIVVPEFDDPDGEVTEPGEIPTYLAAPAPQIDPAVVFDPSLLDREFVDEVVTLLFGDRAVAESTTTTTEAEAPAPADEPEPDSEPEGADPEDAAEPDAAAGPAAVTDDGSGRGLLILLLLLGSLTVMAAIMIVLARRRAAAAEKAAAPDDDDSPEPPVEWAKDPGRLGADDSPFGPPPNFERERGQPISSYGYWPPRKGPCDDKIAAAMEADGGCAAARAKAEATQAAADAKGDAAADAETAASTAAAEAKAKADILAVADAALDPGSSYIEDDEGRITSGDLALKNQASAAAYAAYQAGKMTAGELEAEWSRLGDREAIEELRKQAAERRGQAKAEADAAAQKAEEAEAAAEAARADAEAAEKAAADAKAAAEKACDDAEAARRAADECLRKEAQRLAEEAAAAQAAAEREAEEGEGTPPGDPEAGDDGSPDGESSGGDTLKQLQERHLCCPCGVWFIYGYYTGGHGLIRGTETHWFWAVCTCNSGVWIEFTVRSTRWGVGLGGEGGAITGFAIGLHVSDVQDAIGGAMLGLSGDLSLGVSAGAIAKSAVKAPQLRKALQAASKALKDVDDGVKAATNLKPVHAQALSQAVEQTEGLKALILPLSGLAAGGVQVGLWKITKTTVYITGYENCGYCPVRGTKTYG